MTNKTYLVIRREYMERVNKKSFIITTLLMPLLMLLLMCAPALLMQFGDTKTRTLAVIDRSEVILPQLHDNDLYHVIAADGLPENILQTDSIDGVLEIGIIPPKGDVNLRLYTKEISSPAIEEAISSSVDNAVRIHRLEALQLQGIDEILAQAECNSSLQSIRINGEESTSTSSTLSVILGMVMTFFLYMVLLLYGNMVMTSIIEEKNNRVLEIVVSSVSPMRLMMGKILGVALVAITQIVIWGVFLGLMSAFLLPALLPTEVNNAVSTGVAPTDFSPEMFSALTLLSDPTFILSMVGLLILFLIGGFLLYAAIYAAIGSSVDNVQDAGQLQGFVIYPIIIGIFIAMTVVKDPSTQLAFWTSIIPFTSPMVMMARIPFGIPSWQIVLSLVLLYASFVGMIWIAGKIYRIGIFMYGKKPSIKEILRWLKY